ncbi:MAG: glutamate racemase [Firmicutes bacterium]|nr:glutamate racemase [Bacillota bacterium]
MNKNLPIGIFDSGVGGITVLGRALELLPEENFIYYADTAHFPYGDQSRDEVREHIFDAVRAMVARGIKMLVVACNTATAAAIADLREMYDFPVLGIEPALKPAVESDNSGVIAVIATQLTLKEEKFRLLFDRYAAHGEIQNLPAVGLADLVEQGHYKDDVGRKYLRELFDGVSADTIVLGCTHYLFTEPLLREIYPDAKIIDGGEGLARNIVRTLDLEKMRSEIGNGNVDVMSSSETFLPRFDGFFSDIRSILKELSHKMD